MSLWAKVQRLPQEDRIRMQGKYNINFPVEVRHNFASWIEDQPWKNIDTTDPSHEQFAAQLYVNIMELIERKANDTDFMCSWTFRNYAKQFKEMYSKQPMKLVCVVRNCLITEECQVRESESITPAGTASVQLSLADTTKHEIQRNIDLLEKRTDETDKDLTNVQLLQEEYIIDYQNRNKISAQLAHVQQQQPSTSKTDNEAKWKQDKEEMNKQLQSSATQILRQRMALASKHKETLMLLKTLEEHVVDQELKTWKRRQQLSGNGEPLDSTLIDILQKWCECLADLIWRNRMQIIAVDLLRKQIQINIPNGLIDLQPELNQLVAVLLSNLVTSSFIVEQQPPQVLKKDSRFAATVRLLVGGKLNLQLTPPRVRATLISEQQARGLTQNKDGGKQQKCGDILNNVGPMVYHQHTGQLSITFRNMSLKNIKRTEKKGAQVHTVAEEKLCLLFSSDFNVGGSELRFHVSTPSLPVVVTVHGNQECEATATYLWDNQFSEPERILFQVPDKVPWSEVACMLSTKFSFMTGRGLNEGNLNYLANKLFGTTGQVDFSTSMVTWTQFNKENLPGRSFTFWEWFWLAGKLVSAHLKSIWTDGLIIGFMERTEAKDLLLSRPNGTFLLRFSDGVSGGITVAFVADSKETPGERQVWYLAPFEIKDFVKRGLADRVKDHKFLFTLYPDIPKDQVFQRHYSPAIADATRSVPPGYLGTSLINVVDGQQPMQAAGVMDFNNPQTPQAYNGPMSPTSLSSQPMTPYSDAITRAGDITQNGADEDIKPEQTRTSKPPVKSCFNRAMDSSLDLADIDFVGMASPSEFINNIDLNELLS